MSPSPPSEGGDTVEGDAASGFVGPPPGGRSGPVMVGAPPRRGAVRSATSMWFDLLPVPLGPSFRGWSFSVRRTIACEVRIGLCGYKGSSSRDVTGCAPGRSASGQLRRGVDRYSQTAAAHHGPARTPRCRSPPALDHHDGRPSPRTSSPRRARRTPRLRCDVGCRAGGIGGVTLSTDGHVRRLTLASTRSIIHRPAFWVAQSPRKLAGPAAPRWPSGQRIRPWAQRNAGITSREQGRASRCRGSRRTTG